MSDPTLTQDGAISAVIAAIVSITGLPDAMVYRAFGDGPVGTPDRIVVTPISDIRRGTWERDGAGINVARRLSLQIDGYGLTAVDGVHAVADTIQSDGAASRALSDAGVAVQRVDTTRDTTALQTSTYEPRATLSIVVGYIRRTETQGYPDATSISVDIRGRAPPTLDIDADDVITITE